MYGIRVVLRTVVKSICDIFSSSYDMVQVVSIYSRTRDTVQVMYTLGGVKKKLNGVRGDQTPY